LDEAAVTAARQWTFQPARRLRPDGEREPVAYVATLILDFRLD